jgi:hypothetical protein
MKTETIAKKTKRLMGERILLPPGKVGEYSVEQQVYPGDHEFDVVGTRYAMFTGSPMTKIKMGNPTVIHSLKGPEGTWMTDLPCEMYQMHEELARFARGRVLVGGLGLGIVARMASLNPKVTEVTVVERSPEVCQLVGRYLNHGTRLVPVDLFAFAKELKPDYYQTALLDIWQGTGEWVWQTEVVPLRRLLASKIKTIHCWQEGVMLGQVGNHLFRSLVVDPDRLKHLCHCHIYAFGRAARDFCPERLRQVDDVQDFKAVFEAEEHHEKSAQLRLLASLFLTDVGSPMWESQFGEYWDEAAAVK